MVTANPLGDVHETRFNEDQYPIWKRSFDSQTRHDLVDEDLLAGKSVGGLLVTLVTAGLVLGIFAIIMAWGY